MKTCEKVGTELKEKIDSRNSVSDIYSWIHRLYFSERSELSEDLLGFLGEFLKMNSADNHITVTKDFEKLYNQLINYKLDQHEKSSLAYLQLKYGKLLKEKIDNKLPCEEIGKWSYAYYYENMLNLDYEFQDLLKSLAMMEEGPEFEYTYEQLNQIADDLIAGKTVVL